MNHSTSDSSRARNSKSKRKVLLALGILAISGGAVATIVDDWSRDFTTNVAETDPASPDPQLRPLRTMVRPAEVAEIIKQWTEQHGDWELVDQATEAESEAAVISIRLVRTTRVFRFKDDIHILIGTSPESRETVIQASSRSRIGKGDLGQNPRNLKILRSGIAAKLLPPNDAR